MNQLPETCVNGFVPYTTTGQDKWHSCHNVTLLLPASVMSQHWQHDTRTYPDIDTRTYPDIDTYTYPDIDTYTYPDIDIDSLHVQIYKETHKYTIVYL